MKSKMALGILMSVLAFGSVTAEAHGFHRYRHSVAHRTGEHSVLRRVAEHRATYRAGLRHSARRFATHIEARAHDWRPSSTEQQSAPSDDLRSLVARLAAENGVPYSLANAVVTIESRYNPHAASGAGALGLMQIKAQTARGLGFRGSPSSLFDPDVNLQYGMRYLALAYRQSGGSVCGTVMRYESGTAATHMSAANRAYCSRAFSLMGGG